MSSEKGASRKRPSRADAEQLAVLTRHREEWLRHRGLVDAVMDSGDYDQARFVKLMAETLKIRQDGERRTWGLADRPEPERCEGMEIRWKA